VQVFFLKLLNELRIYPELDRQSLEEVEVACFALLDVCQSQMNIQSAVQVISLANTFYSTSGDNEEEGRRSLMEGIKTHPVWTKDIFWKDALLSLTSEQLRFRFDHFNLTYGMLDVIW